MIPAIALTFAGLVLLVIGGDLLVRGAVNIARRAGLSPLVIGVTLVGFGTSTPELITSVRASLADAPGVAFGNIVGSNIANLLLILGASALFVDLHVSRKALRRDGFMMLFAALTFAALAAFGDINRLAGAIGLILLVIYIFLTIQNERMTPSIDEGALLEKVRAIEYTDSALSPENAPNAGMPTSFVQLIGGLSAVLVGGYLLVDGAILLARGWGVSETIIGLTIVAVGTSAPELVTSLVAAIRKQGDIAFGNVVGSNIYNILAIGGATALIAPASVPEAIVRFDNLVMIARHCSTIGVGVHRRCYPTTTRCASSCKLFGLPDCTLAEIGARFAVARRSLAKIIFR